MAGLGKTIIKANISLILPILLTVTSCAERRGNSYAELIYKERSELVSKKASKTEIISRYKKPTYKWRDKSGREVYNYQYVTEVPFAISYIPIISVFIRPISKINRYDSSLTFDKNDNLTSTSFSANELDR